MIKLTAYEWHLVLEELAYNCRFVNRDSTSAKHLWDKIAKQLNKIELDATTNADPVVTG